MLYALCLGSVVAEFSARLEPLGNTLLLGALFVLTGREITLRRALGAGVLLGVAVDVKLWWLAPAAAVAVGVAALTRSPRRGLLVLAGTVAPIVMALAPFYYAVPHRMLRMIVTAQLARSAGHSALPVRLSTLVTADEQTLGPHKQLAVSLALVVLVVAAVVVAAWRRPASRLVAGLLVVQLTVLVLSPNVFGYYTDYLMVPAGIVLAAGADSALTAARHRVRAVGFAWAVPVVAAGALLVSALADPLHPGGYVARFPRAARITRAAGHYRCVMSDSPAGLIAIQALDRSFSDGCRDWVDVTAPRVGALRRRYMFAPTISDQSWSALLQRYLASGDAILVVRTVGIGLNGYSKKALKSGGTVASNGKYTIYRTVPAARVVHR